MFLEMIKSIVLGIVEGISEWLPISSTGHMILVNELINNTEGFTASDLYLYVIQLGAILAVVTLYFHKLNPFSPKKTNAEKENTWKMWFKVIIACVPAAVIGLVLDNFMSAWEHWQVVSAMLILYGVAFGVSLLKVLKYGLAMPMQDVIVLLTGMVVAYIVSMLAIKFLMNYVRKHNFKSFGYYRIILGILVILYFSFIH